MHLCVCVCVCICAGARDWGIIVFNWDTKTGMNANRRVIVVNYNQQWRSHHMFSGSSFFFMGRSSQVLVVVIWSSSVCHQHVCLCPVCTLRENWNIYGWKKNRCRRDGAHPDYDDAVLLALKTCPKLILGLYGIAMPCHAITHWHSMECSLANVVLHE